MKLTADEARFLTALLREQNQTGCRGPAHDLLHKNAYPDAPLRGPGSLAFSYEAVPLTGLLLKEFTDLQEIDDYVRRGETISDLRWPWSSPQEYRNRLQEARREWAGVEVNVGPATNGPAGEGTRPVKAN